MDSIWFPEQLSLQPVSNLAQRPHLLLDGELLHGTLKVPIKVAVLHPHQIQARCSKLHQIQNL